jgi:hypothetical protein
MEGMELFSWGRFEPHSFVEQVNSSGWGCAGSTGFVNNDTLMKDI